MIRMPRVMVYDRLDNYLCDINPKQIREMPYTEAVNGEHSLTIVTTQKLEKTNRILILDGTGEWHEYVVLGIGDTHDISEYYCVWSMEYDLSGTFINGPYDCGVVPGHASIPQLPRRALEVSLGDTTRWEIGTITVTTMSSASFYRRSGWEGLQTVLERWGGELHASIEVGQNGVISRKVDLLAHEGVTKPTRRFDYGHDVTAIARNVSDDIWPCRIVPLGKSQETDRGGYTRRPDIGSVNDGVLWLQNDEVAPLVRVRNPQGEWEYPVAIIKNDSHEEPAALKAWALENLSELTAPKVSYTASVAQFASAGLNPHGVGLGDEVIVVDRKFRDEGLRISARVVKIQGDLLDASKTKLTIGNTMETLGSQLRDISMQVDTVGEEVARASDWQATAAYVSALLGRLNDEANSTGGWTYITQGEGIRTYSVPVSDPIEGTEAKAAVATGNGAVVEIKGGTIRIANSLTQAGDWDWKTVLISGHIAAELVTAAQITTGYIGNASSGSFWDLDQNTQVIGTGASIAGRTPQAITTGIDNAAQAASDAAQAASDATTAANNAAQAAGDAATTANAASQAASAAAQAADDARKVATNYLTYSEGDGLDVGYSGTNARTNVSGSGVEIFDGNGDSAVFAGVESGSSVVRVGKSTVGHALVDYHSMRLIDSDGDEYLNISDLRNEDGELVFTETKTSIYQQLSFSVTYEPTRLVRAVVNGTDVTSKFWIRYGAIALRNSSDYYPTGTRITFTYVTVQEYCRAFTFGTRDESSILGPMSVSFGTNCVASEEYSVAIGNGAKTSAPNGMAVGVGAEASGFGTRFAFGEGTLASKTAMAIGHWNTAGSSGYSYALIVGNGLESARKNCLTLNTSGVLWVAGGIDQSSDRRLKTHHAYLGEDACDFVRKLKPALFTKDGERHVGFYAQDVQEAEPNTWDTVTVTAQHTDESLDFDPLALDYTALIAPLVAYAQALERRIEELEKIIRKEEA